MNKHIFVETVRQEAKKQLDSAKAQLAVGLAISVAEETLPPDPVAAAKHLVARLALVKRDIPCISSSV